MHRCRAYASTIEPVGIVWKCDCSRTDHYHENKSLISATFSNTRGIAFNKVHS